MSDQDSERAAKVAMTLLRHLHAWGPVHEPPPDSTDTGRRLQLPDPFSTTQAVLAVLSSLTKRHSIALKVPSQLMAQSLPMMICWPSARWGASMPCTLHSCTRRPALIPQCASLYWAA